MAWILMSLRRLRDERLSALGVAGIVLVTAFIAAATPRLIDHVANDTLQATVLEAPASVRNIQFIREDRFDPGDSPHPFESIDAVDQQLFDALPAGVAGLVRARAWTIDSGRWAVPQMTGDQATMRLRIQPDAAGRLELTAGAWPTAATTKTPDAASLVAPAPDLTTFEVAISEETAADLRVGIGDVRTLVTDATDQFVGRNAPSRLAVRIVGLYKVKDKLDPWWLDDTTLAAPAIRILGDTEVFDATALLAPEAYSAYMTETQNVALSQRYTFRQYLDPSRLRASTVDGLLADFKRLETTFPSATAPALRNTLQQNAMREGVRALLEAFQARWASATAILTVGGIGPAAVAVEALVLVIGFAAQRRRSSLALARGRGASIGQAASAVVAEGLLLGVPAAGVAAAAALAIPAGPVLPSLVAAASVALVTVVLLIVAAVPATSGPAFGAARDATVPARPSIRRLLFEALTVVVALAGAELLRERGIRGASSTGQLAQADPFVAAVPALVGLAAGLIAVRLFPLPMRLLAWLARRRRGLVPMLAMRRATDGSKFGPTLIVLLATAAIWAFSSSVLVYFDRASEAVAWRDVGAAYRIRSTISRIPGTFDPTALPGVESVAAANLSAVNMGARRLNVELVALDIAAYGKVTSGTPAALDLPLDMYATDVTTIPVVVSQAVSDRLDGVKVGETFSVTINGFAFEMHAVGVVDNLPGLDAGTQFAIASRDQMLAVQPGAGLAPSTIYLRAPASAGAAIRQAVATQIPVGAAVSSRADETAALRAAPVARAVVASIAAAALIAFLYAVLAVAAGLALTGAARAIEVAHLRTLGLSGRQVAGLVIVEQGPVVVTALLAGIGLGLATFAFLRQGLGLEVLVGSQADVSITPDPAQLAVILGGIVAVVAFGLGLGAVMQRGATPAAALRRGFE